jgi:hypothetical protein
MGLNAPTLTDIARKHGWTFQQTGAFSSTEYAFQKGNLYVAFSRQGRGYRGMLTVRWREYLVPWEPNFTDSGTKYHSKSTPKEVYADALLGLVTEEDCKRRIEEQLRQRVSDAENELRQHQGTLAMFLEATALDAQRESK